MIAKLWAESILEGKKTFGRVPVRLKDSVRMELERAGKSELAVE